LFIHNDGESHPPSWIGFAPCRTLKRLVIYYVVPPEYKDVYDDQEVCIGCPENLVYFEFSSYVHDVYNDGGEMESLVEARLDLRLLESTTRFDDYTETGRCGDLCPCYHRPRRKGVIDWRKEKVSCLPYLPLKVLEISGYGGTCREIEQMRFFLGGLQYLELVKIGVQPESDCNKLRSNLMRFPRLSSKCNIQFI
ncbi:hypothetical protein F2Q68_00042230, partial [Brassica cretica]